MFNLGKKFLGDYLNQNLNIGSIKGNIGLTSFEFLQDTLELVFNAHFDDIGIESQKLKKISLETESRPNAAFEVLVDENFINGVLASLYHTDYSFKL